MAREITIGNIKISDSSEAYVCAEVGSNHQGDIKIAKELIHRAADAGVQAVKLQKKAIASLYSKELLNQPYDNENSFGRTYGEHKQALEFENPKDWETLFTWADRHRVQLFATAFDEASADFLSQFDPPAYKIHSGGLTDLCLLEHVAKLGKPVILSTGGGRLRTVRLAVQTILQHNPQLVLLQATAAYPCDFNNLDLRVIETYRKEFPELVVGYSGHDNGIAMACCAYAFGARVIEKHFTLNRSMKGTDHAFSLEPAGLRKLVRDVRRFRSALGDGVKRYHPSEVKPISKMRRKSTPDGWRITGAYDQPDQASD